MTKIVIVGAGPAGLLAALYLLQRPDHQVEIFEKRSDFRGSAFQGDRTFPIALESRGLGAIREIPGLETALDSPNSNGEFRGVWTVGMSLHSSSGKSERRITRPVPMLSVERNHIASTFLRQLFKASDSPAENSCLTVHFDAAVVGVDNANKKLQVKKKDEDEQSVSYDVLMVCDGARSKVRQLLAEKGLIKFEETTGKDSYKSIYISRASKDGTVELDGDRLHGWMFGDQRVISVPTREKEAAGVFIFPQGQDPFSDLPNAEAVLEYIRSLSPTSLAPLVTLEEAESLRTRPVATTVEVTCDTLTIGTDIVLLGDASKAVSASLGQGCNSALQDVQVLMGCVDQYEGNWAKALTAYNQQRLPEAHAIWELSTYNNPRSRFMRFEFLARMILSSLLPKWLSRVLLRPMPMQLLSETNLPYTTVLEKSRWWTDRVKHSS